MVNTRGNIYEKKGRRFLLFLHFFFKLFLQLFRILYVIVVKLWLAKKGGLVMVTDLGQMALLGIILHLVFIALSWWALQAIQLEKLLRANHVMQARVLYILLAIVIGSSVSNFFLDYLQWSKQLPFILQ